MEKKDDLYSEEELELLNKLSIITKEFQDKYNEVKSNLEKEEQI